MAPIITTTARGIRLFFIQISFLFPPELPFEPEEARSLKPPEHRTIPLQKVFLSSLNSEKRGQSFQELPLHRADLHRLGSPESAHLSLDFGPCARSTMWTSL